MALRGVIFDMDGVLCDSEPFLAEAATRFFKERYQQEVRPADFAPFVGTGEDRYLGGVAEQYGIALDMPDDKRRTYETYLEVIRGRMPAVPGTVPFVESCLARGFKIAIATSADRFKMAGNLREIGLPPERFHAVVAGDDVARKKPDPQIFLLTAEKLGLAPSECLVIEDALHGIEAARKAGCRCLALTTTFDEAELRRAHPDWTAADLSQVPESAVTW